MQPDNDRPRDRHDMEFELHYSIRLLTLHTNLARNTDRLLDAVTLLGLSSAVGSLINQSPVWATAAGAMLTITAVSQVLFKPAEKRIRSQLSKRRYTDLLSQARQLNDDELDARLANLHGEDLEEIEGLRLVAEYDTRHQLGIGPDGLMPLRWWNRLLKACS